MTRLKTLILTCILLAQPRVVWTMAQDQDTDPGNAIASAIPLTAAQIAQISEDMTAYIVEVLDVEAYIATASPEDIQMLKMRMESVDVRWQAYTQVEMMEITASPVLVDLLSQYKMAFVATSDSLANQQRRMDALRTFNQSAAYIMQSRTKYNDLSNKALEYSLVKQTEAQLANVKAQEAILMTQVDKHLQEAVEAASFSEEAKLKLPELQQQYVEIKVLSEKIQQAVYKPWLERVKDYVLTFAGIAIILIFINFIITKIKALKQARDLARKYKDMLSDNDDYPTI